MLTHIVLFTLSDQTDADEVLARLRDLPPQIPSLINLRCGRRSIDKPNAWDIALVTEHTDAAGLTEYVDHPIHVAFLEWLKPRLSGRAVVDSMDFR